MHLYQFILKWRTLSLLAVFYSYWRHSKMLHTRMPCPYKPRHRVRKFWHLVSIASEFLIGKIYSSAMLFWLLKPRFADLFVSGGTFVFLLCAFASQFLSYISVTPISVISENVPDVFEICHHKYVRFSTSFNIPDVSLFFQVWPSIV